MSIRLDENNMKSVLLEEMTKNEILSIISSKLGENLNSREFKKKVKEIAADVVNEIFKILWQRNSMWKQASINC